MDKGSGVREMFGRIAPRYDLANTAMTLGMDAAWRRRAVAMLDVAPEATLLDLCCGTGALTRQAAARVPGGKAVGVDFSEPMLAVARARKGPRNLEYRCADVLSLPFENATFDGATMGFSMRNVVDIPACLREIARVLRPGAAFVNLEVGKPPNPLLRRAFALYFFGVVPVLGGIVGGDAAAYRYLPQSLVNFPDADALAALFSAGGFERVRYVRLMGGAAVIHWGAVSRAPLPSWPARSQATAGRALPAGAVSAP